MSPSPPQNYGITTTARMVDMNCHTIRAWERRYKALDPLRNSENNRRKYSPKDIERLRLLSSVVNQGHQISLVATLSNESLALMCQVNTIVHQHLAPSANRTLTKRCLAALKNFEILKLKTHIEMAEQSLSSTQFVTEFAMPLLYTVQANTAKGIYCPAKYSAFCFALRTQMMQMLFSLQSTVTDSNKKLRESDLSICFATCPNDYDEFLILSTAILAAQHGHSTHYLGANLSAVAVAGAARAIKAKVIVIGNSLDADIYHESEQTDYVNELNSLLPPPTQIWWCGVDKMNERELCPNVSCFSSRERLINHVATIAHRQQ